MPVFDAQRASCFVFTFKDGLLSKIAHDLKIKVEKFEVKLEDGSLEATIDATSLRVVCARKDGRDAPGTLSDSDKKKIEGNIQKDVLETRRHRDIRFVSESIEQSDESATIRGKLTLHGSTRPVELRPTKDGERWVAEVSLDQTDYGIKPYSAMLGALKIQPKVDIRIEIPVA